MHAEQRVHAARAIDARPGHGSRGHPPRMSHQALSQPCAIRRVQYFNAQKGTRHVSDQHDSPDRGAEASVSVNTSNLSSHYCYVTSVNSTREEVVLSFGINQNWDRGRDDLAVTFLHRVILSPQHARRVHARLTALITEYEKRHGALQG